MFNFTALFKAVLDVVMANSQWCGEKDRHPVQFYSLPAGLHQQAANTQALHDQEKYLTLLSLLFSSLSASGVFVCVCASVYVCKYSPVFVYMICLYLCM